MLRRSPGPRPNGLTHDEGDARLAAEHVANFGCLIDKFIHSAKCEIDVSKFGNGARADHRGADGCAHNS